MSAELAIIAKLQDEASSGIRALREEVEGLGDSGNIAASGFAALQSIGTVALTALAAAAAAVGGAIVTSVGVAADFEDQIAILSTAAQGAGTSLDSLRDAALAVGSDVSLVGVNAAGAADAMTILYKAGLTTGEIFGDLNGYLSGNAELSGALRAAIDGAAASELDMAQAADLAATVLATFGGGLTTTEERAEFVNVALNNFVQAADASNASVGDLAASMATIGPTAAQFGFSLQDTNTALALLSTRGISGSEAGTALKSMFVNLMRPTADVQGALASLNVSLYNADGTMRSMPQIVGDLSQALYGLNERTIMVGGRTAEQNHQLELARASYDQATDAIYKHNAGLKVLTDSQLQKYVEQQSAANAEIERLSAVTGTASTAVSQLTDEQRNQYIQTLAGSYGMKAMAVLLMEGTAGWEAMEKAISEAATIQEVAAARTQTFSGAMEALSGVVETIRIGIGSAFLPVLTELARTLAELASQHMQEIVSAFEALGTALTHFFDALMGGTPPLQAFVDAVAELATALGMPAEQVEVLRDGLEGFLTAVSNIVGPIVQAITSFVSWKDVLALLGISIASVIIPALFGIVQAAAPIVAVIGGLLLAVAGLRHAWESDFLGIRTAVEGAAEMFSHFVEAIRLLTDEDARVQAIADALERLPGPLQALAEGIATFINTLRDGGSVLDAFKAALGSFQTAIFDWAGADTWSGVGQVILDKIAESFRNLGDRAATVAANILNWITTSVNSINWFGVGEAIVNGIAAAVAGVVGLLSAAGTAIVNFLSGFFTSDKLQAAGQSIIIALGSAISGLANGIGSGLESIRQAIFNWAGVTSWSEVGGVIIDKIAESFRNLGDKMAELEANIFNWISGAINNIDWHAVGESIINGIVAAITAVVGLLVAAGTAIVNYFAGFFTNEEVGPAASNLITSLGNAIGELASGINDGLVKVRDAIFAWAGVEDWSGVAQKIIEMIGNALATADAALDEKLQAIEQAIFDWAGAEDWSGVAGKILEMIGAAIVVAASALNEKLGAIEQAIFDWAGAEDWSGVAGKILEMIGAAIVVTVSALNEKLGAIEQAIFDWAGTEDWLRVAQKILEMIGAAFIAAGSALDEKLGAIEQAIFDWAGVEDWTGVAGKILEMIGNAFASTAVSLTEKLGAIPQAILDWAGVEDWSGVGEKIAEEVGDAANAAADTLTEQLDSWAQEFLDWAGVEDWSEVGSSIAEKVGEAANSAADTLTEQIDGWVQEFLDWAGTEDWNEVGTSISEKVGEAASASSDSLTVGLADWSAAILEWTDKEDFSESGLNIVLSVVEGLGEFATECATEVSNWLDELNSEVAKVNWYDVGYNIVYDAAEGLGEFARAVADTVSGWGEDLTGEVEKVDWKATGDAILKAITDKIADISTFLTTTLPGWIEQFKTQVAGMTWDQVALAILAGIVANLFHIDAVPGADLGASVTAWKDAIKGKVQEQIAQFNTIGTDIINGIAAGLSAGSEALRQAIQGIIDGVIAGFTSGFQEHSPSRIMIPIGYNVTAGIGVGIEQGASAALDAIRNVASQIELEGVKAFGEAMEAIAKGVAAAMSAILDIGSFGGAGEGFGAAMQALVDMMAAMVAAVAKANTYTAEVLENLGTFVEAAEAINDLLVQTADVVDYIGRWRTPDIAAANGSIELLVGFLAQMVQGIVNLNLEAALILGELGDFLDSAAELPALFMGVADVVGYLAGWRAPGLEPVLDNINELAAMLNVLVTAVAGANTMGLGMLDILATFTETALGVVALIAPLADAIRDIATFPPGAELSVMQRNIETMAGYLAQIVTAVAGANTLGLLALEQLGAFVEVATDIVGLVGPMAEAMYGIANFPQGTDVQVMARNIEVMAGYLHELVAAIAESNTWGQMSLELLDTFVQVALSIAELVTPLAEAIWNIANFQPPNLMTFIGNVSTIANHLAEMVAWFNSGVNYSLAALEALDKYIEVMTAIAEGMSTFIDAIAAIVSFESPDLFTFIGNIADIANHLAEMVAWLNNGVNLSQAALDALGQYIEVMTAIAEGMTTFIETIYAIASFQPPDFITFIAAVASIANHLAEMVAWFYSGLNYSMAALEALGQYVEVMGDLVDLIADAIEALGLIAAYSSDTAALGPALSAFAADLMLLVQTLATAFSSASAAALAAILAAGEFADAVGDILDVVEDGVDALTALAEYMSAAGLESAAQQFADDLVFVLLTVVDALVEGGVLSNAALSAAGELADSIGDVMGAVEDGVEGLIVLATYISNANLRPTAEVFAADLATVLLIVADALAEAGVLASDAFSEAAELSDGIVDLVKMIGEAVKALNDLSGYGSMEDLPHIAEQFARDLAIVLEVVVAALVEAGVLANIAIVQAGALGDAMKDLLAAIGEGVDALTELAKYTSIQNVEAIARQFAADLAIVIMTVANALLEAGVLASQAVSAAGALGEGLQSLLEVINGGVGVLASLGEFVAAQGLGEKARQFAADLAEVILAIANGLEQAGVLASQAVYAAGAMAEQLGALLELIDAGLKALGTVADYTSKSGLQAKIAAFTTDLIDLTFTLATALSQAAASIDQEAMTAAAQFATDAAAIAEAVGAALDALAAISQAEGLNGLNEKIGAFATAIIGATTLLSSSLSQAAAQIGQEAISAAVQFAADAAAILAAVNNALEALAAIGQQQQVANLAEKIQAFTAQLIAITTFLAQGLSTAASQLGQEAIAAAISFSASARQILEAVDAALTTMSAIGENKIAAGLADKIQAFAQQLIAITLYLAQGLSAAASQLGPSAIADAVQFATNAVAVAQAVDSALQAIIALANNNLSEGLVGKIQALGQQLVLVATFLSTSLAQASQAIGAATVTAATAFASAVAALAIEVGKAVTALGQLAGLPMPNLVPILNYIVASAQTIQASFTAAGDIGQAVQYAEAFRQNLEQLVQEIQGAVAALNQIAGAGTSGSIGAALANIADALKNTEGQFVGAGDTLAGALIDALRGGIDGGEGEVVQALGNVLEAARNAGEGDARDFERVGDAVIDAISDGIQSGQGQVIAAVVQVIGAAVAAGINEAKKAADVGRQFVQSLLAEINNGRAQLDSSGAAAGNALIEGMARAITTGKSRVINAIIDTIRDAIAAAKAALGIASPSKVADALMSNFMNTASNTVGRMSGDLASSMYRAMTTGAVAAGQALAGRSLAPQLAATLPQSSRFQMDSIAVTPAGRGGYQTVDPGRHSQVVIYGDLVLPGVADTRSFLEELDALKGVG